jgi:hypothetical protein
MFKRTKLITAGAVAALLISGIATATAASGQPNKKMTHVSSHASKSAPARARPVGPARQPTGSDYDLPTS